MSFPLLLVLFAVTGAFAQNSQQITDNGVLWTFKEKMKLSPEQILNAGGQLSERQKEEILSKFKAFKATGETDVTNGSTLEAEIHAAINPTDTNNIVISPIRQDLSAGAINCPVYYTTDFGDTWMESSFQNMPHEAGMISGGGGDPVFAFDADGKLYFTWIDLYATQMDLLFGTANMGIFWAYSEDGGANWTQPANDTVLFGQMQMMLGSPTSIISPISDKQWMAVDRTNGQYRNNLYISYVTIGQSGQTSYYQIKCSTKPAGVDAFTIAAEVTLPANFSFVQFASVGVDNLGYVHVIFYGTNDNGTSYGIFHSKSTDGGVSFSAPQKISNIKLDLSSTGSANPDEISGITAQRTYPSPYMGADMGSGNIYATWTAFGIDSDAGTGSDIYFSRSTDHGNTWSTPVVVNDDAGTNHNYYSSIFVKDDGAVILSWYDRRDDPSNLNTHYYYATSTDGGQSFGTNTQVTTLPTDFSTIGSQNQDFGIGEYTQVLATDGYIIPTWCDGRGNDGNVNVYVAFISEMTVGLNEVRSVSDKFSVADVYPNPAENSAKIEFTVTENTPVDVVITDLTGKIIKTVGGKAYQEGTHEIEMNISDIAGGNYYCVVKTNFGMVAKSLIVK